MDDRYPVAIGYMDLTKPDHVSERRISGHLTQAHFDVWRSFMNKLADADSEQYKARKAAAPFPPTGDLTGLHYIVISQEVDAGHFVMQGAPCSVYTISQLIAYFRHWTAVENELEAEMEGAT